MPKLELVRRDKNYYLEFEVRDSEGELVDISDCKASEGGSIVFKVQKYSESTICFEKIGDVVNGTLGLCQILIEEEFNNFSGKYRSELELNFKSGKTLTVPNIIVEIIKDLPFD